MECGRIVFTAHALKRMFERAIAVEEVRFALERGEQIEDYPDDFPYPSRLLLATVGGRPIHVVAAFDEKQAVCYA